MSRKNRALHRKLQKTLSKVNNTVMDGLTVPGSMALPTKHAFNSVDELKDAANAAIKTNAGHSKSMPKFNINTPKNLTDVERKISNFTDAEREIFLNRQEIPKFLQGGSEMVPVKGLDGVYRKRTVSNPITPEAVKEMQQATQSTISHVNGLIDAAKSSGKSVTPPAPDKEGPGKFVKAISSTTPMKAIAGASVASLVMGNMVRSKGQQSNAELYGQRMPYM